MTVYVDTMSAPLGRMKMCHMAADSTAELLAMADTIGLNRTHLQDVGTYREHFDVCQSKRAAAIAAGAVSVGQMEFGRILRTKRTTLEVRDDG